MDEYLQQLRKKCLVGLVGGSDIVKIAEQIGGTKGYYTNLIRFLKI
jgi:hypothetical protein